MLRQVSRRLCSSAGSAGGRTTGMGFMTRSPSRRQADADQEAEAEAASRRALSAEEQATADAATTSSPDAAKSSSGGPASSSSSSTSRGSQRPGAAGTVATIKPPSHAPTRWMEHSSWTALGDEFKHLHNDQFLRPTPAGFLTNRAVTDVQPAEELLHAHLDLLKESYQGLDVRDPKTMLSSHQGDLTYVKTSLSMGDKVRAVAEFMSGHIAHQVALPQWQKLFDLSQVEMDLQFWLWILHLHIISRRSITVNINHWARRREVLQELLQTMFNAWVRTSEEVMGRPPLQKIRDHIKDMYYVSALNIDEALLHDGPGGDMMLMAALVKFCPLPRPEDVPMYTYYTLVHYIRFHTALFDRLPDEEFCRGNFHFLPPDEPTIFASYTDVEFDDVAKSWMAAGHEDDGRAANAAAEENAAKRAAASAEGGESAAEQSKEP